MEALLLSVLAFFVIPMIGVLVVKSIDQGHRDSQRKTYKLSFPSELNEAAVTAWIRSISGTLRFGSTRLVGVPTVAFELWATNEGMVHRLKVPWAHADYVVSQLRSLVPGIRVTPEDDWPRRTWTKAVEVALTRSSRPLRIYATSDVAASLLASVQALDANETVIMQWVVTPAIPKPLPIHKEAHTDHLTYRHITHGSMANRDEVRDRREKLSEPNMMAVLRVAAVASTPVRAEHLIYRVRASLASTRHPSSRFVKRLVSARELQKRIDRTSGSTVFPIQLSAPELTALVAWPIGSPFVTGLPPRMSRQLPASDLVPTNGRVIGRSNMPGSERRIAVDYMAARKHSWIVGPTGVGKTALMANIIKQDIDAGHGVVVIDAKGGSSSLFSHVLDYIPRHRIEDAIIIDVQDTGYPLGFNILDQGDPKVVVDQLIDLFKSMHDSKSLWTDKVLYHGLRTIATDPRLAFIDLGPLLVPVSSDEVKWRDQLIRGLQDLELKQFWQQLEGQGPTRRDQIVQPVLDRVWQLNARPELRHIIGQSKSSFQMADVITGRKILLVNLGGLAADTASLTGTLLMNALWHAAKTTPTEPAVHLHLDEFHRFVKLPIDPESMLAEARGFGLSMTLAHQHINQLPSELRAAVLANARTKIVFQTSADDAKVMSREFGNSVDENDFTHLGKYEAIARVATGDGVSAPLTMTTIEPAKGYGTANAVRYVSRQKYGRPAADVAAEIAGRRKVDGKAPGQSRPRVSSWDADDIAAS